MKGGYIKMSQINNKDTLVSQYDINQIKLSNSGEEQNFAQFNGEITKIFEDAKERINSSLDAFYKHLIESTPQSQGDNLKINAGLAKTYIEQILHLHISALKSDEKLYKNIIKLINETIKKSEYIDPQSIAQLEAKDKRPETSLEILKTIIPKKHIKSNNKLANRITKDLLNQGETALVVSSKKSKREVTTKVMLAFDSRHIQLSGHEKYTPYDREVYDGVVTLYEAGNEFVTLSMIYRAMNGLTDREYVSIQSLESVTKSLDKSRYIQATIDYTEEAKLYNRDIEKAIYQGYLLAAEKVTVKINGTEQEGYKLLRKPILYEYAQISGQIITVPTKLLQTKDAVRSTDEVIVIRGYLLRQIEWIRNETISRSENVAYKSVYDELDVTKEFYEETPYKKKTAKIRSHVKSILDEWKEQGYIKNYEEYHEGRTLKGIKIII